MKLFIKTPTIVFIILLVMLVAVNLANAGVLKDDAKKAIGTQMDAFAGNAGYEAGSDNSALILVQTVINIFLSIIGVLLLVYILYAGYNWLTAQGEEEKVTRAKDTIKRAIVGAIIIVAAYAISMFVMSRLEKGTLKGASAGRTVSFSFVIPAKAGIQKC